MFGWFKKRDETEKIKEDVQHSFDSVKEDFSKVGKWISHFDANNKIVQGDLEEVKKQIFIVQNDLEEIKDFISFFGNKINKQPQTSVAKQMGVADVQTVVQTAVQTGYLDNLSTNERAIVWAMINTESSMKLSYEDLAAMFGKDKSTIRGQINAIKQKSEGLIEDSVEPNGKKRLYIPEEIKQIIVKTAKVRVRNKQKMRAEQ